MEYVVDFNDPLIHVNNSKIIEKLDKGLKIIETEDQIEAYVSVNTSLDKKLLKEYSDEQKAEIVSHISEILKYVFEDLYKTSVQFVDVLERKEAYLFTPYTPFSTLVFENSEYLTDIPTQKFIGYKFLSNSPLARYVINTQVHDADVRYFRTSDGYLSMIRIDFSDFTNQKTYEIEARIDSYVTTLEKEGYFGYSLGIHDLEDLEVFRDLCSLYDISIVDETEFSTFVCKTEVDFKTTPREWIHYNLPRVKSGLLPIFSIKFDFSFFNDYSRLYGWTFKDVILKYATYLAYAKLSDSHPIISSSITSIRINEDLSISVALPSYSLVKMLKEYILENLNDGISYTNDNQMNGKWNIERCANLKEGVIKRWGVQQVDPDAYPMVFKNKDNEEILIHRSPLAIKYPSRFDFKMKDAEESLFSEMKKYYSSCHDDIEPVLLEQISQMDLDELLSLITVLENGKKYCFTNSTIGNLVKKENPLTRRPLTEKTLKKEEHLEQGWRGLFDIGVLFGLYPDIPVKYNVPLETGIIKITREYVDPKRRDLVGNVFLVEVLFEDGTNTPLFEISLPILEFERINQVREAVNKLWYQGYFLSEWDSSVYKYLAPKSFPVIVNSPVLINAADSIYDGNIALEMLLNLSK